MEDTAIIRATLEELRLHGVSGDGLEAQAIEAWNTVHHIETVNVISAHELSAHDQHDFTAKLPGAYVQFSVDSTLIAGVRIEWPDRTFDHSALGMIDNLRRSLTA